MDTPASGQGQRGSEVTGLAASEETKRLPSVKLRRRGSIGTILLVVVVEVIVVMAALTWYIAQLSPAEEECTCHGDPCIPLTFSSAYASGTPPSNHTASWMVAYISCPFISSFASFKAATFMNWTPLGSLTTIVANATLSFGTEVKVMVTDTDGNGKLTAGDRFFIYGMSEPRIWRFSLIWAADGSEIEAASWSTP